MMCITSDDGERRDSWPSSLDVLRRREHTFLLQTPSTGMDVFHSRLTNSRVQWFWTEGELDSVGCSGFINFTLPIFIAKSNSCEDQGRSWENEAVRKDCGPRERLADPQLQSLLSHGKMGPASWDLRIFLEDQIFGFLYKIYKTFSYMLMLATNRLQKHTMSQTKQICSFNLTHREPVCNPPHLQVLS